MINAARHAAPLAALLATMALGAGGCGGSSPPAPAPPPAKVEPAAPAPAPVEPASPAPQPAPPEATKPPPPAAAPAKPPAKPAKLDPVQKAEKVVTAPRKGEREKVGAGQCRACHRIQYDSWVKSGHARKRLDCEGCHGDGSEYAKNSVMRDPAKAKAAGLIFQNAQFCEKCHPTADASFLPKAHAHKPKPEPKPEP
jgi:hypothetical protein